MPVSTPVLIAGAAAPAEYDADVVILALDRAAETVAAIGSALAQRGASRHVIVLDQGSRPEALAALAACVAGRSDAGLWRTERNLGVAGGRNVASALGRGRVIVALDNDAEFAGEDVLAACVQALDEAADLAAIGMRIVVHATGADDLSSWGYPVRLLAQAGGGFDATTFVGAGHAIRRTAWEAAGGYDAALFFCWEEYDFCLRAIALGWRIAYRGQLVVRHKVSGDRRVAWSGERWFYFVRNRLYLERKWGRSGTSLLPRFAGYLLKGMRNGVLGQTLRAWPAARRLAALSRPMALPAATAAYVRRNDTAHRGNILARLRTEVLAALPGRPAA